MDFIFEAFKALIMVGLPIGVFTFLLVWWALSGEHFKESSDPKALEAEIKAMSKDKESRKKIQNLVHREWVKFGGGFYGIVAFFTYIVIETKEIISMIIDFGGFISFLRQLGIDVIISVFIEAIMNFVAAMVWPLYWMRRIDSHYIWLWFLAAYAGFWLGKRYAQQFAGKNIWIAKK